jgi:hypothetical protein
VFRRQQLRGLLTGDEDAGGIDSAIVSTARGESRPNKPNTPSGCLSVAGQTNSTPIPPMSWVSRDAQASWLPGHLHGNRVLGRTPVEPRDPVLNAPHGTLFCCKFHLR